MEDKLANVSIGSFAFLLQDYFVQDWADNFVMHMLVTNLDQWWHTISKLGLESRYKVRAPRPPKLEPWGLRVAYLFDPSGVLWHVAEDAQQTSARAKAHSAPPVRCRQVQPTEIAVYKKWCGREKYDFALLLKALLKVRRS